MGPPWLPGLGVRPGVWPSVLLVISSLVTNSRINCSPVLVQVLCLLLLHLGATLYRMLLLHADPATSLLSLLLLAALLALTTAALLLCLRLPALPAPALLAAAALASTAVQSCSLYQLI